MDDGTKELAHLESDPDLLKIPGESIVSHAIAQLLGTEDVAKRVLILKRWDVEFPSALSRLLMEIAKQPELAAQLASTVIACRTLDADAKDELLAAAFPLLQGPVRDAAADRPGVRALAGVVEGHGYVSVPAPEAAWLWPQGKPFPKIETDAGVQARLNHLGLGAGPIDGEWNERTRHAFARFQVLNALDPTGEPDFDATETLELNTPKAP